KSSLTHHFKALRAAGVIRQRQYGLERRSHVRVDDLEARFPGLLALVAAWEPARE
ncbi:ArsR family transcriptional regulator, partial [Streptomyces sp. PRKS01-65]|nr:ArsR family transcriptional regulator [Streptomyces harenosi]